MKRKFPTINPNLLRPFLWAVSIFQLTTFAGCDKKEAVVIHYDQVQTSDQFKLSNSYLYIANGIKKKGFWATYIICDLRNDYKNAVDFPFDMKKFYVDYHGIRSYYKPLMDREDFGFGGAKLSPSDSILTDVIYLFRKETQIGPEKQLFKPQFYPNVGYRFSLYVAIPPEENFDWHDARVPLFYDGGNHPMICNTQGHDPILDLSNRPLETRNFPITCRPPNQ
jgi:hypothetical protein